MSSKKYKRKLISKKKRDFAWPDCERRALVAPLEGARGPAPGGQRVAAHQGARVHRTALGTPADVAEGLAGGTDQGCAVERPGPNGKILKNPLEVEISKMGQKLKNRAL